MRQIQRIRNRYRDSCTFDFDDGAIIRQVLLIVLFPIPLRETNELNLRTQYYGAYPRFDKSKQNHNVLYVCI